MSTTPWYAGKSLPVITIPGASDAVAKLFITERPLRLLAPSGAVMLDIPKSGSFITITGPDEHIASAQIIDKSSFATFGERFARLGKEGVMPARAHDIPITRVFKAGRWKRRDYILG